MLSATRVGFSLARNGILFLLVGLVIAPSAAQHAELRKVPRRDLPTQIDGNSPSFWHEGKLNLFSSIGSPEWVSQARDQFGPWQTDTVQGSMLERGKIWVESAWMDSDGILFAWYHHEPAGLCADGSPLTAPEIGAAVSFDGGKTLEDLGIVLKSGELMNCQARNGYFGGGHGDFTVVPDRANGYFYFIFSNYSGALSEQGVVVARMAPGESKGETDADV